MSELDQLPGLAPTREYIVIIICLAKSAYGTSIKYALDSGHEVYVISRVPSFAFYLEKLMVQMVKLPKVRFFLVNNDMNILVDVLRLILRKSVPDLILQRREEYLAKYRANLLKISGHSAPSGPEFHVTLPPGHADLPQAFDLVIIQNSDEIDESNYLEEKHVFTQQALRFIALKHGVRFASVSGIESLIHDTHTMIAFTNRLFQELIGADSVIYKPEGLPVAGLVYLHQFIPIGWDAWNKIMLVAKSVPRHAEMLSLITTEVQMDEFNDTYDDSFADLKLRQVPNGDTQFNNTTEVDEKGKGIQESKEKLSQYLTIEPTKLLSSKSADPPISYEQFLQSLSDEERIEEQGI